MVPVFTEYTYKCPRYGVNCIGPFSILFNDTSCPAVDSVVLMECITRCMSSHCCRAGGIQPGGQCVFNYLEDTSLHFIKTVPGNYESCKEGKKL